MAKQKMYWTDEKIAEIKVVMEKAKQKKQPTKAEKEAFAKKMMSADVGYTPYWTDERMKAVKEAAKKAQKTVPKLTKAEKDYNNKLNKMKKKFGKDAIILSTTEEDANWLHQNRKNKNKRVSKKNEKTNFEGDSD